MNAICTNILQATTAATRNRLSLLSDHGVLGYSPGNDATFAAIWNAKVVETGFYAAGKEFTEDLRGLKNGVDFYDMPRW